MATENKQIQLWSQTAATWTGSNPTLLNGQIGIESDTLKFKIGNGSTAWTSLAYAGGAITTAGMALLDDATAADQRTTLGAAAASHAHAGSDITSGTVDPARLGSGASITTKFLRGDSTWQAIAGGGDALTTNPLSQFAATTSTQLAGVISDETGSGALVFANTPTLVTPVLGVATATSINKVALTAPATGATLTLADGSTLTVSASATISNGTHSGTNTGDQTSIVGISGTKAQFDSACSDGNFLFSGDITQYTDEMAQDAVGAMVDSSLVYTDGTPLLQRAALTGDVTASAGSNTTAIASGAVTPAKLSAAAAKAVVTCVIDGGTATPTVNTKVYVRIPFAGTITKWSIFADASGSAVVDVWKDTWANFPPTVADTIAASAKPTLSTAQKNEDSTLTGWTTSITAGDVLGFNLDSVTTCKRITVEIEVTRT